MNNTIAILCLLLAVIKPIQSSQQESKKLKWKVNPTPAHFNKTVRLVCTHSYNMCFHNKTRKWSGGHSFNEIALHNLTSNITKYTVKTESCFQYSLYIHHFSEKDINCSYSCAIGFYEYRHVLSIDDYPFEYIPGLPHIKRDVYFQNVVLYVHVHIAKVYPVPICFIRFSNKNLTRLSRSYPKRSGSLYQFDAKLNVMLDSSQCSGHLIMSCNVGTTQINVIDRSLDDCNEPAVDRNANNIAERLPYLLGVLIGICLINISIPSYGKVRGRCKTPTVISRNKPLAEDKQQTGRGEDAELMELTECHSTT